jgi:hypothetical protein
MIVLTSGVVFVAARRFWRGERYSDSKSITASLLDGVTVGAAAVLLIGVLLSFSDRFDVLSFWKNNNSLIIITSLTAILRGVEALFTRD